MCVNFDSVAFRLCSFAFLVRNKGMIIATPDLALNVQWRGTRGCPLLCTACDLYWGPTICAALARHFPDIHSVGPVIPIYICRLSLSANRTFTWFRNIEILCNLKPCDIFHYFPVVLPHFCLCALPSLNSDSSQNGASVSHLWNERIGPDELAVLPNRDSMIPQTNEGKKIALKK